MNEEDYQRHSSEIDRLEGRLRKWKYTNAFLVAGFALNVGCAALNVYFVNAVGLLNIAVGVWTWHQLREHQAWLAQMRFNIKNWRRNLELARSGEIKKGGYVTLGGYMALQLFCDRHKEMFKAARSNMVAVTNMMTQRYIQNLVDTIQPSSKEEFEEGLRKHTDTEQPICCQLGDEFIKKVLAVVPVTHGSQALDEEDAKRLVPEMERVQLDPPPRKPH